MAITQRLTLDEFLALPDDEPALELEPDGTVVQKVSPQGQHSSLQFALCERINGFARPRRLAVAFPELRTIFGGAAYVPDVTVFRWERIPRDQDGELLDDVFIPPDIAVEIRSPGQSLRGQVNRCRWYVEKGVEIALLVDPDDRSVRLFRADAEMRVLHGEDRIDLDSVLPGFELSVQQLFDALTLR